MTNPLPAPVAGVPFDVQTAAGRVTAYRLGEGRTVLLLHSFNAAGSGIELAPLASRLAKHRRVVLVDQGAARSRLLVLALPGARPYLPRDGPPLAKRVVRHAEGGPAAT